MENRPSAKFQQSGQKPSPQLQKEMEGWSEELEKKTKVLEESIERHNYPYPKFLTHLKLHQLQWQDKPPLLKAGLLLGFGAPLLVSLLAVIGGGLGELSAVTWGVALLSTPLFLALNQESLSLLTPSPTSERLLEKIDRREEEREKLGAGSVSMPFNGYLFLPLLGLLVLPSSGIFPSSNQEIFELLAIALFLVPPSMLLLILPMIRLMETLRLKLLLRETPTEVSTAVGQTLATLKQLKTLARKAKREGIVLNIR